MFQHILLKNFLSHTHKFEFTVLILLFGLGCCLLTFIQLNIQLRIIVVLKMRKLFDDQAKKAHKIKPNKIWTSVLKSLTLTHINTLPSVP